MIIVAQAEFYFVFLILILWLVIFLMECLSNDIISTLLYAIPFIISFFLLASFSPYLAGMIQIPILLFVAVIAIMILVNILKCIIL